MKNKKNNKTKNNYYILIICLIFVLSFIVKFALFRDCSFYKLMNPSNKINFTKSKIDSKEMEQEKFEISFNEEDLIEKQKWISVEAAGEVN